MPDPDSTLDELLDRSARIQLQTTLPGGPGPTSAPPERLGRYPVAGRLGEGGMGEVLLVRDGEIGREMAAKVIRGSRADPLALQKFLLEAQVTGQLEHPNIVPVHELGLAVDGRVYFTMKRIEGRTLAGLLDLLRDGEPGGPAATLPRLLEIFLKICDALAFAHSRGVIHRDLKPANVMVGAFGEVLVVDWGLAKVIGAGDPGAAAVAPDLTDSPLSRVAEGNAEESGPLQTLDGQVMGTPAYMSPEQARGEVSRLDQRTDVYALGAVLYELLSLEPPYHGMSAWDVISHVLAGPPPAPSERAPQRHIPWELEAVVKQAMAPDPEQRYSSVPLLRADVEAFLAGRLLEAARYGLLQRGAKWVRRHRAASLAAAAALVAVVAALAGTRWFAAREARRKLATAERRFAAQAMRLRGELQPALTRLERLDGKLTQPGGAPDERAVTHWYRAHLRAAERLEHLLALADQAPSTAARRELDLPRVAARHRALCLDAAGRATELAKFVLARMWIARAGLSTAEHRRRIDSIEDAERRRSRELLDRGRAILAQAADAKRRAGFEFMLAALVRLNSPEIVKLLLEPRHLDAKSEWKRRLVYAALGRLGDIRTRGPEGIDPVAALIRRLEPLDPVLQEELAVTLAFALGHLADARAHAPLDAKRWEAGEHTSFWSRTKQVLPMIPLPPDRTIEIRAATSKEAWRLSEELTRRGHALAGRGELAEALRLLDRAVELVAHPVALIHRGVVKAKLGRHGGALADFTRVIELEPSSAAAWENRGNVHHSLKRLPVALADLDRAVALEPTAQRYYLRGNVQMDLQRLDAAAADFERALTLQPKMARVYLSRGKLRILQGQTEQGLADFRQAIALDPRDPHLHNEFGDQLNQLGRREEAIASFTRALTLDPRLADAYYNRGNAYRQLGRWTEAEADYTSTLALDPRSYNALVNRGVVRVNLSRRTDALEDYRSAVALRPDLPDAYLNLGVLHNREGSLRLAIEHYGRALEAQPSNLRALRFRAQARSGVGDLQGAINDYTRYLRLQPGEMIAHYNRGMLYEKLKQPAEALADYQAATRLAPQSWQPWVRLGGLLWAVGRKPEAIAALTRGRDCAPAPQRALLDKDLVRLQQALEQERKRKPR